MRSAPVVLAALAESLLASQYSSPRLLTPRAGDPYQLAAQYMKANIGRAMYLVLVFMVENGSTDAAILALEARPSVRRALLTDPERALAVYGSYMAGTMEDAQHLARVIEARIAAEAALQEILS